MSALARMWMVLNMHLTSYFDPFKGKTKCFIQNFAPLQKPVQGMYLIVTLWYDLEMYERCGIGVSQRKKKIYWWYLMNAKLRMSASIEKGHEQQSRCSDNHWVWMDYQTYSYCWICGSKYVQAYNPQVCIELHSHSKMQRGLTAEDSKTDTRMQSKDHTCLHFKGYMTSKGFNFRP